MAKIIIDSDDIAGLSSALQDALERKGVLFRPTKRAPKRQITGVVCGGSGNGVCGGRYMDYIQSLSQDYGGCGSKHCSDCGGHYDSSSCDYGGCGGKHGGGCGGHYSGLSSGYGGCGTVRHSTC